MPNHPMTIELLNSLAFPVAAPSANPFGYISPTTADHVLEQLGDKIDYVLDGGACQVGIESTIIGFEAERPVVYRKGGITVEQLEELIGQVEIKKHSSSNPSAPGMLKSHYAPKVPIVLGAIPSMRNQWQGTSYGILSFKDRYPGHNASWQVVLSTSGDLTEAAQNLFAGLRYLDQQPLEVILAELVPEKGLGRAINDRLRRAAATKSEEP